MNLFTSYYDSGMIASCIGNAYLAKAFPPLGGLGAVHCSGRKKRAILPNEPILFSRTFRWSNLIFRNLCRLQRHLQMGSFSETNPFRRGSMTTSFWYKISRRTATERRGYKEEKRRAERREDTTAGGAATTERGPPELWGRYGPGVLVEM